MKRLTPLALASLTLLTLSGCVVHQPVRERVVYVNGPAPQGANLPRPVDAQPGTSVKALPLPSAPPGYEVVGAAPSQPVTPVVVQQPAPPVVEEGMPEVVSLYVDPPTSQPAPVVVEWAPPPLLDEYVPLRPFSDAYWVGGYWAWDGDWYWVAGRWMRPPSVRYMWQPPYYECRGGMVIFIHGYWRSRDVMFMPPHRHFRMVPEPYRPRYGRPYPHVRPIGGDGVFVPAPPGSRWGVVVQAEIGAHPRWVIGSPALRAPGMRLHSHGDAWRVVATPEAVPQGRPYERRVEAQPVTGWGGAKPGWQAPQPALGQPWQVARPGRPSEKLPEAVPLRPQPPVAQPVGQNGQQPGVALPQRPGHAGEDRRGEVRERSWGQPQQPATQMPGTPPVQVVPPQGHAMPAQPTPGAVIQVQPPAPVSLPRPQERPVDRMPERIQERQDQEMRRDGPGAWRPAPQAPQAEPAREWPAARPAQPAPVSNPPAMPSREWPAARPAPQVMPAQPAPQAAPQPVARPQPQPQAQPAPQAAPARPAAPAPAPAQAPRREEGNKREDKRQEQR